MLKELSDVYISIGQRTFECEAIYFFVEWKNDSPSVRMLHFDMAPFSVDLNES